MFHVSLRIGEENLLNIKVECRFPIPIMLSRSLFIISYFSFYYATSLFSSLFSFPSINFLMNRDN